MASTSVRDKRGRTLPKGLIKSMFGGVVASLVGILAGLWFMQSGFGQGNCWGRRHSHYKNDRSAHQKFCKESL